MHETTNYEDDINPPKPQSAQDLAAHLVARCRLLLSELDELRTQLTQTLRNPQLVEVRTMRSNIVSELKMLEKLAKKAEAITAAEGEDEADQRVVHALRSSNLPFHEAVWSVAKKSCTGLVAFGTRFYWDGDGKGVDVAPGEKRPNKDKKRSVFVDIVADDGEEWVKVSTISENRLLFEMAKKGWEGDSDSGEEDEENRTVLQNYDDEDEGDDDDDELELIKLARDMRKASDATRVMYKHPRIRFVLPKIVEGESLEIDDLLKVIRGYGITVECGGNMDDSQTEDVDRARDSIAVSTGISRLLPTPFKRFTSTLNVDCTLLLAVVSDLSHYKDIPICPSHHKAILRQMEVEKEQPLLPAELWPAMDAHELVCTDEAAKRMREIVDTIGTDTEKKRTEILMGDAQFHDCDREALIQKFQELSDFLVPTELKLPVKVVEAQSVIESGRLHGKLPKVADRVVPILSDINYSVFFYGWATGLVTISSNRTVVREIEATVEEHRDGDEDLEGPPVWVCNTARSLIGKDKDRK
ncbi:hypothetical protein ASPWEDRAFT_447672 [Aspergillus wentii DTO 134E9]|uniref:DUF1308 domain-containing protein n=1 Tax=Aspergillus wentii DTO 134E9 TaxID=1073089 RepID=A0A1L9RQX1_ASPWE|nr:uncharacterized protein ASPWEDRAFT_447672 [Aspergillus wentii DTO 134E9]KAI9928225.1 hypothetical protein MW887_002258 [Aspergillus wentii]OJJ37292.1 hypothetical protein ASPWEDRAFT_447672 [Aspergillus wentii DTO 134E9]